MNSINRRAIAMLPLHSCVSWSAYQARVVAVALTRTTITTTPNVENNDEQCMCTQAWNLSYQCHRQRPARPWPPKP